MRLSDFSDKAMSHAEGERWNSVKNYASTSMIQNPVPIDGLSFFQKGSASGNVQELNDMLEKQAKFGSRATTALFRLGCRLKSRLLNVLSTMPPIMKLPDDAIRLISSFLSNQDKFLFGLVRRKTYGIVSPFALSLEMDEQRAAFELLQRDYPNVYYCSSCIRFHRFNPKAIAHQGIDEIEETHYRFNCTSLVGPLGAWDLFDFSGTRFRLAFYHCQLAMNRHFYGNKHGLPLKALAFKDHVVAESGLAIHETWTPRIIDDELFLSATYVMSHTGDPSQTRRAFNNGDLKICPHLATWTMRFSHRHYLIPQLMYEECPVYGTLYLGDTMREVRELKDRRSRRYRECVHPYRECQNSQGFCRYCLTDYKTTIVKDGDLTKITIITYYQLGQCRSPEDWKWKGFCRHRIERVFSGDLPDRSTQGYNQGDFEVMALWQQNAARTHTFRERIEEMRPARLFEHWLLGRMSRDLKKIGRALPDSTKPVQSPAAESGEGTLPELQKQDGFSDILSRFT